MGDRMVRSDIIEFDQPMHRVNQPSFSRFGGLMWRSCIAVFLFVCCYLATSSLHAQDQTAKMPTRVVSYEDLPITYATHEEAIKALIEAFKGAYPEEYQKIGEYMQSIPVVNGKRTIAYKDLPPLRAPRPSPDLPDGCNGNTWNCFCNCNGYLLEVTGVPVECMCTCVPGIGLFIQCPRCPDKFAPCS